MKIEVGQTYKFAEGGPCKIVHKLDLPGENHPYLGVSLACGSAVYFNETGTNRDGSIRLIGESEEPKLRPFTRETFPVDAWLRKKDGTEFYRTFGIGDRLVVILGTVGNACYSWSDLLEDFEYSVDGCKTWHPCGVRE